MENYDEFEVNGQKFKVSYQKNSKQVYAVTYVNGQQVKTHGDSVETAYWAIQQHVYTLLNFKL